MKIAITGSPKSGKTTYTKKLSSENIKHTDDLIYLGWSRASEAVSYWFDDNGVDIVEGVAIPRALRTWLERNKYNTKKPVEKILYFHDPFIKLSSGQKSMSKANLTVWNKIKSELKRRRVIVEEYKINR